MFFNVIFYSGKFSKYVTLFYMWEDINIEGKGSLILSDQWQVIQESFVPYNNFLL